MIKKLLLGIFIFILAAAGLAFIFRSIIVRTAVVFAVTKLTGFETRIGAMDLQMPARVEVKDIVIKNPKTFQAENFAAIPELFIDLDAGALIRGERFYIRELRFNLAEVNIEKNPQGISNINLLTSVRKSKEEAAEPAPEKKTGMPFRIERFELTLRNVSYNDRTSPLPQKVSTDLRVDKQVFTGITDPKALVTLVLTKIIYGTTFGRLLDISPAFLQSSLKSTMQSGEEFFKQTSGLVGESASRVIQETKGILGDDTLTSARTALGTTTGTATKRLSGLMSRVKSSVQSAADELDS